MSELIVIGYESHGKASAARTALLGLSKEYLLQVGDAVIASRDEKGEIKLDQMVNLWTWARPAARSGACSRGCCSSTRCWAW